jgi:hypothetical protein
MDDEQMESVLSSMKRVANEMRLERLERKVSKAAEAFYIKWKEDEGNAHVTFNRLVEAVEALQAERGSDGP